LFTFCASFLTSGKGGEAAERYMTADGEDAARGGASQRATLWRGRLKGGVRVDLMREQSLENLAASAIDHGR
jgi:hypothetical protein